MSLRGHLEDFIPKGFFLGQTATCEAVLIQDDLPNKKSMKIVVLIDSSCVNGMKILLIIFLC